MNAEQLKYPRVTRKSRIEVISLFSYCGTRMHKTQTYTNIHTTQSTKAENKMNIGSYACITIKEHSVSFHYDLLTMLCKVVNANKNNNNKNKFKPYILFTIL